MTRGPVEEIDTLRDTLQYYFIGGMPEAVRISISPYRKQDWMINLPLYATGQIMRAVK